MRHFEKIVMVCGSPVFPIVLLSCGQSHIFNRLNFGTQFSKDYIYSFLLCSFASFTKVIK